MCLLCKENPLTIGVLCPCKECSVENRAYEIYLGTEYTWHVCLNLALESIEQDQTILK